MPRHQASFIPDHSRRDLRALTVLALTADRLALDAHGTSGTTPLGDALHSARRKERAYRTRIQSRCVR